MKKIILVIHTNTYFSWLIAVGCLLKKSKEYEPIFIFKEYPTYKRDFAVCLLENISAYTERQFFNEGRSGNAIKNIFGFPKVNSNAINKIRNYTNRVKAILFKAMPLMFKVITRVAHYNGKIKCIRSLILKHNIALIILAGDLVSYDTSIYIKAGHDEKVASLVIPGWMAGPLESVQAVYNNPDHWLSKISNKIVGKIYPHWIYQHNERELIRLPADIVIAMEMLKIAPPNPWVLHSGYADVIAVESEEMRQYCIKEGLPPDKIDVTGSVAHDEMVIGLQFAKSKRETLYTKLGLEDCKPMILTALPPNMMGGYWQPDCEYKTYEDLIDFWLKTLAEVKDYHVIVSLHPSVSYNDMKYIEQYGVKVAQERTMDLIPLCDFFVACISSTIQWAIACGKPVLNYDVYRYRYTDYLGVPGVLTFEEQEKFKLYVRKLALDELFYNEILEQQQKFKDKWGKLDGHSGERIIKVIDNLTKFKAEF